MAVLDPGLRARLRQLKVHFDKPDDDTLVLRNVPTVCFSKPTTSVLVKRPRAGLPFLVCVDEDLEYIGPDRALARVFAAADRRQGWRVVSAGVGIHAHAGEAVHQALAILGVLRESPTSAKRYASPVPGGLLARFARSLTAQVNDGSAPLATGREELAEQAATSLLSWQGRMPVLVAAPGLGKTALLFTIARRVAGVHPDWNLLSVDLSGVLAGALWEGEREKLLSEVLDEAVAGEGIALVLERLELAVMSVPFTPWLLACALDRGARLAATCLPAFHQGLTQHSPLARRMDLIELRELVPGDASVVLVQLSKTLAAHHQVAIEPEVVEAVMARSLTLAGPLPDKAITLLDAAAARAALQNEPAVTLCDVYLAASRMNDASESLR